MWNSSSTRQGFSCNNRRLDPASVIDLNQSNSFSKQVSSVTGCLGSVRTAQRAGSCWEHSGSMARQGILGFWSGDGMAPTLPVGQSQACAGFRGQPHVRKRSISGRVGNSCLSLFGSAHLHPTALQPTVCGWGSPVLGLSLPEGRSERGEGGPSVCGRGGSRGS